MDSGGTAVADGAADGGADGAAAVAAASIAGDIAGAASSLGRILAKLLRYWTAMRQKERADVSEIERSIRISYNEIEWLNDDDGGDWSIS